MRKTIKLMSFLAIAALGSITGIKGVASQNGSTSSSLNMANVEALSRNEIKGYMYVVIVHYEKGDGCNCAGDGNKICCL